MGKIIYQPKGKAGEYARYAANFYNGCSGCCEYCYNRTGVTEKVLGGDKPTLKQSIVSYHHKNHSFSDEQKALEIFQKELDGNIAELRKYGLFFNFVSDPFLRETAELNMSAIRSCLNRNIPVIALTKQTWWVPEFISEATSAGTWLNRYTWEAKRLVAFGFTLTGHDELEPGCATNAERIEAMKQLHEAGFKTWTSIEPIIDFDSSYRMIEETLGFCDLYKVGLRSGAKYSVEDARWFATRVLISCACNQTKVYLKDSLIKLTGLDRNNLKTLSHCYVDADYNLFAD
jgi:DNA repair photolyase